MSSGRFQYHFHIPNIFFYLSSIFISSWWIYLFQVDVTIVSWRFSQRWNNRSWNIADNYGISIYIVWIIITSWVIYVIVIDRLISISWPVRATVAYEFFFISVILFCTSPVWLKRVLTFHIPSPNFSSHGFFAPCVNFRSVIINY